ncbi:hypothetical protein M433DRAFT_492046 [Acidomyces richmondensis BFW]|nr:MAG: hypothetical protein FE78DRAFT_299777 [Acidomyces sp. 'richmondensis']KYG41238.1 hypothetical protein M433DRAFT_492046 [Acidomyces richmondensis BFW]
MWLMTGFAGPLILSSRIVHAEKIAMSTLREKTMHRLSPKTEERGQEYGIFYVSQNIHFGFNLRWRWIGRTLLFSRCFKK